MALEKWLAEFVQSMRRLLASPGHAILAIGTLTVGILVTVVFFGSVNGVAFKPNHTPGLDRIVALRMTRGNDVLGNQWLVPDVRQALIDRRPRSLRVFGSVRHVQTVLTLGDLSKPVLVEEVEGRYFDLFHVRPVIGRLLTEAESDCCAVISQRFWQTELGSSETVLGTNVRLLGRPYTVVGVVPIEFRGTIMPHLFVTDAWVSQRSDPSTASWQVNVFARLADDASISSADAEVRAISAGIDSRDSTYGLGLLPAERGMLPTQMVIANAVFATAAIGVSVILLLIACGNGMNLLLAKAATRTREFAVRLALGAGRADLVRTLSCDALAITVPAAIVSSILAVPLLKLLDSSSLPSADALTVRVDLSADASVALYGIAAAIAVAVLLSVGSAAVLSGIDPARLLAGTATTDGATARGALRVRLISWQLAASTALLILAAICIRTVTSGIGTGATFDTDRIAIGQLGLAAARYEEPEVRQFLTKISAVAQSSDAKLAVATGLPVSGDGEPLAVGSEVTEARARSTRARSLSVSADFFAVLGIKFIQGTGFSSGSQSDAVIINKSLATRVWPGQDPTGRSLWMTDSVTPLRVVGVVEDTAGGSGSADLQRFLFLPIAHHYSRRLHVLLRGNGTGGEAVARLRETVRSADPGVPVLSPVPLGRYAGAMGQFATLVAWPLTLVGLIGTLMAAAGLYAVTAHSTASRRKEYGIMKALGAGTMPIVRTVLREGTIVVLRGTGIGIVVAMVIASFLPIAFLAGISSFDLSAFLAVPIGALAVSVLAMLPSAWRADRSDPMKAIRQL